VKFPTPDVKRPPMSRAEHFGRRMLYVGLLAGFVGWAIYLDRRWPGMSAVSRGWSTGLLVLIAVVLGADFSILLESHGGYLERYQRQLDRVHEQGAALFERAQQEGDQQSGGASERDD
jgi:hypothetical protein